MIDTILNVLTLNKILQTPIADLGCLVDIVLFYLFFSIRKDMKLLEKSQQSYLTTDDLDVIREMQQQYNDATNKRIDDLNISLHDKIRDLNNSISGQIASLQLSILTELSKDKS